MLAEIFAKFENNTPLTIMVRALLENVLRDAVLDELFEDIAQEQYTKEVKFSTIVNVMGLVACGFFKSPHAVHKDRPALFPVTLKCFYEKLQGIELTVMRELVRLTAARMEPIIKELNGTSEPLLPGYRVLVLDGNCLGATEHRIKELREIAAAPLPGKTLAVLDPQLRLVIDVLPCECGHAQERSLFDAVLDTVEAGDLWIEDANFCTRKFLVVIAGRQAYFLVREHANLPWEPLSDLHYVGRGATGEVWEQRVEMKAPDKTQEAPDEVQESDEEASKPLEMRRIVVKLDKPTRDGKMEIALLSNVETKVDALTLAQLYLERWQIETAFQTLTVVLNCEQSRLGYPKAALFAFCVNVVAYNIIGVIQAALGAIHGAEKVATEVSVHHLTEEVRRNYGGMMITIPPEEWLRFKSLSAKEMANLLLHLARQVDVTKLKKAPTKPKKPRTPRKFDPAVPHVSTAKILAKRRKK